MSTSLLPAPAPARLAALLSSGMAAITAAALIAPATATAATPHPAPGAAANPSGNFLKLWTAEWMAPHGSFTQEQAVALASRVDYIAAMRGYR